MTSSWLRGLLLLVLFSAGMVGCGPNVDDPGRVPEGAADTSDPNASMKNMGSGPPTGTPGGAGS